MKCILCNLRKAKRFCPVKDQLICAQCCGEKRMLEIDCPESCQFLQAGRKHEVSLEARHFNSPDPVKQQKHQRVLSQFQDLISHLEYVLADERRNSRGFKDKDAADALDLVLENLRTEERGVLYERTSSDLRTDILRRRLSELVQFHRLPREREQRPNLVVRELSANVLNLRDAIECLETIRDVLQSHLDAGPASLSYVDFLARLLPRRARIDYAGSSLIIPGR